MTKSSDVEQDEGPSHALRVTVTTKGGEAVETSVHRVRMISPPSDPTYGLDDHQGCWCELRDREGRVVYRRIMSDPLHSIEAPSGDPERSLMRVTVEDRKSVVVLLVPDLVQADSLHFCESPKGDARDIWSFEMDELRKGAN